MPPALFEYIAALHDRRDLLWPQPPEPAPLKATPSLKPITGIRAVLWNVYGTLLHLDGGKLLHRHPQEIRMQVALDKTIKEFNMWHSMSRKPGQPWEYMLRQYDTLVEEAGMASTKKKGDFPAVDSSRLWGKIIDRLLKNEYRWDHSQYGDEEDLSVRVAYFFHASLQGVVASPHASQTLQRLALGGVRNGLLADAQAFTVPQLAWELNRQDPLSGNEPLSPALFALSSAAGLRKPSQSLFQQAVSQLKALGLAPEQALYVSQQFADDLAPARKYGFHTVLYAADRNSCCVSGDELKNSATPPVRLITDLRQILEILMI